MTIDLKEIIVKVLPDCDVCKMKNVKREAHYDAKTKMGSWGYLCEEHFGEMGIGLGTGFGQRLVKE